MNDSSLNLDVISFVLFSQASKPSKNFNISKMAIGLLHIVLDITK